VGSINVDIVALTARLPTPGETITGGTLLINHGGKGANQAVAARRLGADVRFIGCVGEDTFGLQLQQSMAAEGIGVEGLTTIAGMHSGTAVIVVDAAGRNQIAVASGANLRLTVDWVARFRADFAWAQVVICQLEVPLDTVLWTLRMARQHGATTVLNPAPAQPVPSEIWPLVDYLTPNEVEAAQASGLPLAALHDAEHVARALLARGPRVVILTLGAQGALVSTHAHMVHVPAFPVTVIDTTAAGDAFNGALAVALAEGRPLVGAVHFANAAAGLACTQYGAQNSLPVRTQVEACLADASS
jgi:ribokinase